MRIAFVAGEDLATVGRVRREARALADAGHRVTVYGVLAEGLEAEEDDGEVVLVRGKVPRWRPPAAGVLARIGAADPFARLEALVRLAATRDPPEALHAVGLDAAVPALAAARDLGIPCVFDDAGGALDLVEPPRAEDGRLARSLEPLQRRAADALRSVVRGGVAGIVTTSDALAAALAHRYAVARPTVVRPCAPRSEAKRSDALARKVGAAPGERLLLFHGPLDDARGVVPAVRSLRALPEDVGLVVLGGEFGGERIARVAADAGVAARVRCAALPSAPQRPRLLASADAAVFPVAPSAPSLRLGIPAELLECVAAGLPVVASDLDAVGPLVRGMRLGRTFECASGGADPADVADAVRPLLDDPEAAGACRAAALRAARAELDWAKESRRLVDLYDRIESGRRPPRRK